MNAQFVSETAADLARVVVECHDAPVAFYFEKVIKAHLKKYAIGTLFD